MDEDNRITYTYRLLNNVSEVAEEIIRDTERAGVAVSKLMGNETELVTKSGKTVSLIDSNNSRIVGNMQGTSDEVERYSDGIIERHSDIKESVNGVTKSVNDIKSNPALDEIGDTADIVKGKIEGLRGSNESLRRLGLDVEDTKRKIESVGDVEPILHQVKSTAKHTRAELESLNKSKYTLNEIGYSADEAKYKVESIGNTRPILTDTISKQGELDMATNKATKSLEAQQNVLMQQVVGLLAVGSAVSQITGGLRQMGLVSNDTAMKLRKVNGGFQLINGAITGLKALQLVMKTIQATEAGTAVIETYRATLNNPYKAILAGAAIGASVGIAGALAFGGHAPPQSVSNQETVIVNFNTEEQRGYGQDLANVIIR